jgi:hypothetical protein
MKLRLALLFAGCALTTSVDARAACQGAPATRDATPQEIVHYFTQQGRTVVTFLGYSGAGYEDPQAMLRHAAQALDRFDPARAIVNIGATPEGIGAVYQLAKDRGFATTGIVSTQARDARTALSPCVDLVFYVTDRLWGGFEGATQTLSPTSKAMVESSDHLVAIGGGEVARDELAGARGLKKDVTFVPADFNHAIANERARRRGEPAPADFRGAAAAAAALP